MQVVGRLSGVRLRTVFLVLLVVAPGAGTAQDERMPVDEEADNVLFSDPQFSVPQMAQMWKLSVEEIERFQTLSEIDKPFTAVGAIMTPYEVLGKFARTPQERSRYARMYVEAANANHQRGLEWGIALEQQVLPRKVREAQLIRESELIGNRVRAMGIELPADEDFSSALNTTPAPKDALFYVPTPCEADCTRLFEQLRAGQLTNQIGTIQVVFTDLEETEQNRRIIFQWAHDHKLNRESVGPEKSVRITFEERVAAFGQTRAGRRAPLAIDAAGRPIYP